VTGAGSKGDLLLSGDPANFGYVTAVPPPVEPFSNRPSYRKLLSMAAESNNRKDSLRVEKLSYLVLTLCVVVLVYVLVAKPF
jgi:hypothetical protein